ncbi:LysE type translocator [Desulfopila aestuarii DSM 18488]|uniref:LysE type translocator n=2 Tax=Desulfopila aestuarii TaxID=231440 RepID=A0A1M7YMZ9_9BACT|nr:LysE type translocator [Desulfopila aestuarii DSM 18488]
MVKQMYEIQNYYGFIIAICLFQLFPGAGTIAILGATATDGSKAGMSAVVGTLLGDFIYMSSAVLGLAAILSSYPRCFAVTQYLGVMYLCSLGLKYLFLQESTNAFHKSTLLSRKYMCNTK